MWSEQLRLREIQLRKQLFYSFLSITIATNNSAR